MKRVLRLYLTAWRRLKDVRLKTIVRLRVSITAQTGALLPVFCSALERAASRFGGFAGRLSVDDPVRHAKTESAGRVLGSLFQRLTGTMAATPKALTVQTLQGVTGVGKPGIGKAIHTIRQLLRGIAGSAQVSVCRVASFAEQILRGVVGRVNSATGGLNAKDELHGRMNLCVGKIFTAQLGEKHMATARFSLLVKLAYISAHAPSVIKGAARFSSLRASAGAADIGSSKYTGTARLSEARNPMTGYGKNAVGCIGTLRVGTVSWRYPTQNGEELIIYQALSISQVGSVLKISN